MSNAICFDTVVEASYMFQFPTYQSTYEDCIKNDVLDCQGVAFHRNTVYSNIEFSQEI